MADNERHALTGVHHADALFWRIAEELMGQNTALAEGKIMSSRCLRHKGDFVAMVTRKSQRLVIKLTQSRVSELIDDGTGLPFTPAKKVFKEWVEIKTHDPKIWETLLLEAIETSKR